MAQVLQFQDHIASLGAGADLEEYLVELPPGGFVDTSQTGSDNERSFAVYLQHRAEDETRVRFHRCTADVAISAVTLAQHLDRIPFGPETSSAIDVWIPDIPADLPALRAEAYGWIAFTRGVQVRDDRDLAPSLVALAEMAEAPPSPADAEEAHDNVAVHIEEAPRNRSRYAAHIEQTETRAAGKIQFATDSWLLASQRSVSKLRRRVADAERIDVVASAPDPEREPLMVARARALAEELGLAENVKPVYCVHRDGPESIYLMVRP